MEIEDYSGAFFEFKDCFGHANNFMDHRCISLFNGCVAPWKEGWMGKKRMGAKRKFS
jgi:hypothetical protein